MLRCRRSTETEQERRKRRARERQAKSRKKRKDSPEKRLQFNKLNRERMTVRRALFTSEQRADERKRSRESKKRKRKCSTPNEIEAQREYKRKNMSYQRAAKRIRKTNELLTDKIIEKAKREALKFLHRNRVIDSDSTSSPVYAAHVCVICDNFIIGTEELKKLTKKEIKVHRHRLSVEAFEEYYQIKLPPCLVKQYTVPGLQGLLLSPRAQKIGSHYITCSTCYHGMLPSRVDKPPPKFSIANGFVIGEIPKMIQYKDSYGKVITREVDVEEEVNEILRAMLAPKRPFGYIFAFTGGRHQAIRGHYQFFEMDQPNVSSAVQAINDSSIGPNIFCMCSGRFTPTQREIVQRRCEMATDLYLDLYNWFVQVSGHPAFKNLPLSFDIPTPSIIPDTESDNNTDTPGNVDIEKTFEGGRYYFSSGQDPSEQHSVYDSSQQFSVAMMKCSDPTLLTYGGTYAKIRELKVEDILPFTFPYGVGGPNMKRRTHVSKEACFHKYTRVALRPFLRGDTILVLNHMFGRI